MAASFSSREGKDFSSIVSSLRLSVAAIYVLKLWLEICMLFSELVSSRALGSGDVSDGALGAPDFFCVGVRGF
jgi:hypothetical protein